jgi:hypothetical protein
MRSRAIIALAVALVVTCSIFYPFFTSDYDLQRQCFSISDFTFGHATSVGFSHVVFVAAIHSSSHFYPDKNGRRKKAEGDDSGSKLSVFKGREASLNRAIFAILAKEGPKTIIELQRQLSKQKGLQGTYYASINKRIHCLEEAGYVSPMQTSQQALKAVLYELRPKALLATFMSKKSPEEVLNQITDKDAIIILSDLIYACPPSNTE